MASLAAVAAAAAAVSVDVEVQVVDVHVVDVQVEDVQVDEVQVEVQVDELQVLASTVDVTRVVGVTSLATLVFVVVGWTSLEVSDHEVGAASTALVLVDAGLASELEWLRRGRAVATAATVEARSADKQ